MITGSSVGPVNNGRSVAPVNSGSSIGPVDTGSKVSMSLKFLMPQKIVKCHYYSVNCSVFTT